MFDAELTSSVIRLIRSFRGSKVAVLGDIMLDEYVHGTVSRISPEAPVPILEADPDRRSYVLGGAANVARNLASLGAAVELVGVVGDDREATVVRRLLSESGIGADGLATDPARPTTVKTRIVAHRQQVVRVDHESREPVSDGVTAKLMASVVHCLSGGIEVVVLSDYSKGVITRLSAAEVRKHAALSERPCAVNAKPSNAECYRDYDLVTVNRAELMAIAAMYGMPVADVSVVGLELLKRLSYLRLAVTLGPEGILVADPVHGIVVVPSLPVDVYDVVGAGDTALAAMSLALAAGANPMELACVGNLAGGAVVRKAGTATVTAAEMLELLDSAECSSTADAPSHRVRTEG